MTRRPLAATDLRRLRKTVSVRRYLTCGAFGHIIPRHTCVQGDSGPHPQHVQRYLGPWMSQDRSVDPLHGATDQALSRDTLVRPETPRHTLDRSPHPRRRPQHGRLIRSDPPIFASASRARLACLCIERVIIMGHYFALAGAGLTAIAGCAVGSFDHPRCGWKSGLRSQAPYLVQLFVRPVPFQ